MQVGLLTVLICGVFRARRVCVFFQSGRLPLEKGRCDLERIRYLPLAESRAVIHFVTPSALVHSLPATVDTGLLWEQKVETGEAELFNSKTVSVHRVELTAVQSRTSLRATGHSSGKPFSLPLLAEVL